MRRDALLVAILLSTACSGWGASNGASGSGGAGGTAGTAGAGGAAASGGSAGTGGSAATGGSGGGVKPPYDPTFAINVPIPAGIADDPRSADIVSRLTTNLANHKVDLSNHGEVPTVYTVSPSDTVYTVNANYLPGPVHFRVPAGAVPGEGSDYPMIVLDPDHPDYGKSTELRLWQASVDATAHTLSGNGGGLFHYNNDGAILNPDGTKSVSVPFLGAGTGSGLSYLAGLIRAAEVKDGTIRHAIRFAYSSCDSSSTFRAPAVKTDQPKNCTGTMAPANERMDMGMRLQLDPTLDCSTRTVPGKADTSSETRFLRMFCRALQQYGMIMLDGTSPGGLVIYMENETTAGFDNIVGSELYGSFSYIIRDQSSPSDGLTRGPSDGIPWGRLRVLEKSVF